MSDVTVPRDVVNEALYLLANVPWGSYESWVRDGNTVAADEMQEWSDRRAAAIQSLLRASDDR